MTTVITHDKHRADFIGPLPFVIEFSPCVLNPQGEVAVVLYSPHRMEPFAALDEIARLWHTTDGAVRCNGSSWRIENSVARCAYFQP